MSNNIINQGFTPVCIAAINTPLSNLTGDGTVETLVCDTVLLGSGYNTSTGIFTASLAGDYLAIATLDFTGVANTNTTCITKIVTTSGIFQDKEYRTDNSRLSSGQLIGPSSLVPVFMNAGDELSVTFQISGTPKGVGLGVSTSFSIMRFA